MMMVASPDKVFAKNRAAVRLAMCGDDGEDAPNETVRARTRLISLPDLSLSLSLSPDGSIQLNISDRSVTTTWHSQIR